MKTKKTADLCIALVTLFTISIFTIMPYLSNASPVLIKEEIEFKQILLNISRNAEFPFKQSVFPALMYYSLSFINKNISEALSPSKVNFTSQILFRFIPALTASFVPPLLCTTLILGGASLRTAFVLGFFMTIDPIYIIRNRLFLPDSFLYMFSIFSMFLAQKSFHKKSPTLFYLSSLMASFAIWTDFSGFLISSYMFFFLVQKLLDKQIPERIFFKMFFSLFFFLLFTGFIISTIHIGIQSGPSDILPFSQRILNEINDILIIPFDHKLSLYEKFYFPKLTNEITLIPNFVLLALILFGVIFSLTKKKINAPVHFFVAFLISPLYDDYVINHLQICILFGLISCVPIFSQVCDSRKNYVLYIILLLLILYYIIFFQSTYGGKMPFKSTSEL